MCQAMESYQFLERNMLVDLVSQSFAIFATFMRISCLNIKREYNIYFALFKSVLDQNYRRPLDVLPASLFRHLHGKFIFFLYIAELLNAQTSFIVKCKV